jgi:hypothetical protein
MKIKGQAQGWLYVGPNMAYFDQEVSLSKMVQHIYGNASVLTVTIVEYVCQRIENAII